MKTFKEFIIEASIVDSDKYGVGHKVEISGRGPSYIHGNLSGVFEISEPTDSAIEIGSGPDLIYLKQDNKIYKISGTKSGINAAFNHYGSGAGAKSLTHKRTRAKEAASLIMFKHFQETGKEIDEELLIELFPKYGADPSLYMRKYYDSALLQLEVFKTNLRRFRGKSLIFEFQGDKLSSLIYNKAKSLGGPSDPNNWNPADLWIFDAELAGTILSELNNIQTLNELNFWIRKNFLSSRLLPISLKASSEKAKFDIINPLKYKNKELKYDFTLDSVKIAGSLKSIFIETKSGFTFKGNARAAADNPNLFFEGTMKGENFAMGAIDAKLWQKYHGGKLTPAKQIRPNLTLLNQARDIFSKYKNIIAKRNNENLWTPDFDKMDNVDKQRYIAVASSLDFVMRDYMNTMRWAFFTSMKVVDTNSMYVKIS